MASAREVASWTSVPGPAATCRAPSRICGADGRRVLRPGVLVGDDEDVREPGGDLAHDRALALVAVAVGAEDEDEPAGGDRPDRLEREDQRVRGVRVVDERERAAVAALDDALHAARDRVRRPTPAIAAGSGTPARCASTIARAALDTLTRPGSGLAAACRAPSGPRSVKVEPTPSSPMVASTTAQSAASPSGRPDVRRDGLHRDRRPRRPAGGPRRRRPRRRRARAWPGANSRALSAEVARPCRRGSRGGRAGGW